MKELLHRPHIEIFSHGDFCPWNMLINKKYEFLLFDWEMSGYKPLGYDLFTYLFQTSFLLNPEITVFQIISKNKTKIKSFFQGFETANWEDYLIKFSSIKIAEEKAKKHSNLLFKYQQLLEFND